MNDLKFITDSSLRKKIDVAFEHVTYFKEKGRILEATAKEIMSFNDLRNTFHLNKPRGEVALDKRQVERALRLLVYVIQRAPKSIPASS